MDIDKIVGQALADKSAVGAINRPLRYCQTILLMNMIGPWLSGYFVHIYHCTLIRPLEGGAVAQTPNRALLLHRKSDVVYLYYAASHQSDGGLRVSRRKPANRQLQVSSLFLLQSSLYMYEVNRLYSPRYSHDGGWPGRVCTLGS